MAKETSTAVALIANLADWTRLERFRGAWRVEAGQSIPLPTPGEEGGEASPKLLAASVPEPFALCLESASVLFRCLTLPTTVADEVGDMVSLQLDKLLPMAAEEMTVSYETLSQDEVHTVVLACAVPTALVEAAVARLGVKTERVRRVDVAALACVRLLEEHKIALSPEREAVLLDEGPLATLVVLDAGMPVLARSAGSVDSSPADLIRTIRLSVLQLEVERGPRRLERVTLLSSRPGAEVLRPLAAAGLGCAARVLSPAELGSFSRGAALRQGAVGALDLTPSAWRSAVSERRFRRGLLRVLAGGVVLWALLATVLFGGPAWQDRRAARTEEAIKALQPAAQAVRDVRNRVRMIQAYMDREDSALETLREVSSVLPQGVLLSSFRYQRAERRIAMQGSADSTSQAYALKEQLDASALFAGSEFAGTVVLNPKTRRHDFELVVLLKEEEP